MTPRFDFAAPILLCSEDSATIFDLEEEREEISWVLRPPARHAEAPSGALSIDFPLQSESCIEALLGREEDHLPMEGYAERLLQQPSGSDLMAIRSSGIDWIWKVHEYYKLGPLTAVLSLNYMDRFLSVYHTLGEDWMKQLLTVACLSLAAKMEETAVLNPSDLQVVDAEYVFEPSTVHNMELLVLKTLSWRMQAVTACSFIDYYLHKFSDGDAVSKIILCHAVELIVSASKAAEFLVFKPSEIAASVALVALGKHESSLLESVPICRKELRKERVLGCYEMIQDKIEGPKQATRGGG